MSAGRDQFTQQDPLDQHAGPGSGDRTVTYPVAPGIPTHPATTTSQDDPGRGDDRPPMNALEEPR